MSQLEFLYIVLQQEITTSLDSNIWVTFYVRTVFKGSYMDAPIFIQCQERTIIYPLIYADDTRNKIKKKIITLPQNVWT